jgi:hypothetical protein
VLYYTMILILPRVPCFHRVLQQGQHFFSFWRRHKPPGDSVACGFLLDGQKATTGRASCICRRFKSFKSFKSFRRQQGQKNQYHRGYKAPVYGGKSPCLWGTRPPFMGGKAPVYGGKSPCLWGKTLFMGILKNKGFLKSPRLWGERPPFMGILKNKTFSSACAFLVALH